MRRRLLVALLFAAEVVLLASLLSAEAAETVVVTTPRGVYVRGEVCTFRIEGTPNARVEVTFDVLPTQTIVLDESGIASFAVDTSDLKAGDYSARIVNPEAAAAACSVTVVPIWNNERLGVWRWGHIVPDTDLSFWTKRGFTGGSLNRMSEPLESRSEMDLGYARQLDNGARHQFDLGFYLDPLSSPTLTNDKRALIRLPDGRYQTGEYDTVCPHEPVVIEHARKLTQWCVDRYGDYPAWRHALLLSEFEPRIGINDVLIEKAAKDVGLNLKEHVIGSGWPVPPPPQTYASGIIQSDNDQYRFLKWWWSEGHGTNTLMQNMAAIIKTQRPDIMTWHDPFRLAPVRSTHAGIDCISTWVYGHPDIKFLVFTTYLHALARPNNQLVQIDPSLFLYHHFVKPTSTDSTASIADDSPGSDPYFTAGPDYAREVTWLCLAQRPDIINYYYASILAPDLPNADPEKSQLATFDAIGEIAKRVIAPLGPSMRAMSRRPTRVALHMSAVSAWFPSSPKIEAVFYDNLQTLPYATLLMMNHVPFDVLFDEDLEDGKLLENYDVLVMPKADTLSAPIHRTVMKFANHGGKVIAQHLRAPVRGAIKTDFDFSHLDHVDGKEFDAGTMVTRDEDIRIMEGYARDLAGHLKSVSRPVSADTPKAIVGSLDGGDVQLHIIVNDLRDYGPRFGQWKLFQELGLPQEPEISVAKDDRPILYDVLAQRRIATSEQGDRLVFRASLPAAEGIIVAAVPEPIGQPTIGSEECIARGRSTTAAIHVVAESGRRFDGEFPLHVSILDANGQPTEWQRYTTTRGGVCNFNWTPARNDVPGSWSIRARDLITGAESEVQVQVE